jgi:hypothetical protein
MPKMSNVARVIDKANCDKSLNVDISSRKLDEAGRFCLEGCPHPDKPCDGICAEFKAFVKRNK